MTKSRSSEEGHSCLADCHTNFVFKQALVGINRLGECDSCPPDVNTTFPPLFNKMSI